MNQLLMGAISMGSLIVALFFLRFWKNTRDRFFLFFAIAFALEGANRAILGMFQGLTEYEPIYYLIRLLAFVLILVAIVDKNRTHRSD